jgi:hypothetical protein
MQAKDNCQLGSKRRVGLANNRIMAARARVLRPWPWRRRSTPAQKTQQMMAARRAGAMVGITRRKTPTAALHTTAAVGLSSPAILAANQTMPTRMAKCMPDRLT